MCRIRVLNRLVIFTVLLAASFFVFSGCEKNITDDVIQSEDLGFIDTSWEIASVNGQPFESLLVQDPEPGSPPQTFTLTSNSLVFHASGNLTGELGFTLSEEYPGTPPTSATWAVTCTITGQYTAGDTTLTIEEQNVEIDVVVTLSPKEVWEQQIEGITLEQLQDDLAAESEMGFKQGESPFPITVDVDYTQQTEKNTLTLSVPGETIVLKKIE